MSEKYYYENPKVSDTIIFDIYTPDANCCFDSDPFEIVNLKIYFIERNFSTDFFTQITTNTGSPVLEKDYLEASQLVCQDPENKDYQNLLKETKRKLLDSANIADLQFDNLIAVAVFGSEENPVWELSNPSISILTKVYDVTSNIINGHFQFKFKQDGLRDGDYFLVWNWRPNVSLQKLSASQFFSVSPETYKYIVPANFTTDKNKYPDLLNLYMPEIYKTKLGDLDVSPEVLSKFNLAVGDAFANVENLANNLSSLIDYNLIPEYFLAYMGNFYRLNLYTSDPIRWRRQIAKAVPNFKMKGTINGLKSALNDAGINLISLTQLYQVYSKYTWTDVFYISSAQSEFELSKKSLPINSENFAVYKRTGSGDFVLQSLSYIKIDTYDFISILTWVGPELNSGDTIQILYQTETIFDPVVQSLELYLRSLPLADTRDDLTFAYPPKNWNARVIAPNDQFFNEIIPQKNPFHEPVVFGQIRTDFAYSENIYNMDEYNGCATGDTSVITKNGLKNLKDLSNNDLILTEFGFKKFAGLKNQGHKETLTITTVSGRKITVTENHKFKISSENGLPFWEQAKNLKINDYILSKLSCGVLSQEKKTTDDLWYLIGYLYGDGFLYTDDKLGCTKLNWLIPESSSNIKTYFCEVFEKHSVKFNVFKITKEEHQKHTNFKCNEVIERINSSTNQLPFIKTNIPKYEKKGIWRKNVPFSIFSASEIEIGNFLGGLFDSDGSVQKRRPVYTTKWESLAYDIQKLLSFLGITSSVTSYLVKYKGEKRKYYRTRIIGSQKETGLFLSKVKINHEKKLHALKNEFESTNKKGKERNISSVNSIVIPFANNIAKEIFPYKKRIYKKGLKKTKTQKRTCTLLTRLKQGYQTTIPHDLMPEIYSVAKNNGEKDNEYYKFIESYVENNWFYEKIKKIEKSGVLEVFDPLNVEETYSYISNGFVSHNSTRDSTSPCDIDKNFVDPCSGFITTLFNCDLTIEDLSPDRINEALQIINEYKPFHAVLHSLNYSGILSDYLAPTEETIEILINYYGTENMLANYPQTFFNRDMFEGLDSKKVVRTALATQINLGTDTVIGFNDAIVLYSPLVNFSEIGLNPTANTYLEILSPSPNQGTYTVLNPSKNYIEIYEQVLITQPINQSQFAYRLSNINYSGTNIAVTQQNVYVFSDPILKDAISDYPIETEDSSASPWKIKYYTVYPSYNIYIIYSINPDGTIVLKNDITLPALTQGIYINDIQYELLNGTNDSIYTSVDGSLFCYNNGLVTVNDGNFGNAKERLKVGDWFFYGPTSEQYQITEFGCIENTFRICSWNDGNVTGQSGKILNRIVEDTVGNLSYNGMIIEKPASLPAIEDPNNPSAVENNQFKENFILIINDNLYKIEDTYTEMSQDYLVLGGLRMDLTTQLAGGTSLSVECIQLKKTQQTINDVTVCYIDRIGAQEIVAINQDDVPESLCELSPFAFNASLLTSLENKGENSPINDIIKQEEKIGFKIETVSGQTYEGNLS